MLQLTQINIYPVKSLDGFSPQAAIVEERGLQHDRRWMLMDENGLFMSQRTTRKMTHLRAKILDNHLHIEVKNDPAQYCAVAIETESNAITVKVWDDTVEAVYVSSEMDDFLSNYLGKKCFLVKMPLESKRRVEEKHNTGDDIVSFADGYPYLIIGESSIDDLNTRLENPLNVEGAALVGMRRFRANFVFVGGKPYEEETWRDFQIGNVDFLGCKPCGRCVMTTLDPDSGERSNEPLQTLAAYRSVNHKVLFGQNVIWNQQKWPNQEAPIVKVGDNIIIY